MCIGENARIKEPRKAEQCTPGYPVGYSPFLFTWIYMIEISSPSHLLSTQKGFVSLSHKCSCGSMGSTTIPVRATKGWGS